MKKTASSARPKGPPPLPPLPKAPTGVTGLDEITGGGLPAARPTLVCGTAGCGKTLFSLEFLVRGAVEYGEPGVFIAFEETAEDLQANAASLGFDLQSLIDQKLLIVDYIHLDPTEFEEAGDYGGDSVVFLTRFHDRVTRWMTDREREWFMRVCFLDRIDDQGSLGLQSRELGAQLLIAFLQHRNLFNACHYPVVLRQ